MQSNTPCIRILDSKIKSIWKKIQKALIHRKSQQNIILFCNSSWYIVDLHTIKQLNIWKVQKTVIFVRNAIYKACYFNKNMQEVSSISAIVWKKSLKNCYFFFKFAKSKIVILVKISEAEQNVSLICNSS